MNDLKPQHLACFKYPCGCIGIGHPPTASVSPNTGDLYYPNVAVIMHCDNEGDDNGFHLNSRPLSGQDNLFPKLITDERMLDIINVHFNDLYQDQRDLASIRKGFAALAYPTERS